MNITYTRPGELRKPDIEVLPDGRIRIVRYVAAGHGDRDSTEIAESIGSPDNGLSTALLVKRAMGVEGGKPAIIKTYEVINASSETQVGLPDVSYGDNGLRTVVQDFIQMSSGTYTPGTIGTTVAPTDAGCVLQQEQMQDDGTTRQIRRIYISKGLVSESNEVKNNGALLVKTLVYINDVPSPNPPTGYTLISTQVASPNGLETTTYTFAKGTGQISQDDETKNNGSLLVRSIRYLSVPSVGSNPITTPSGYTLVSVGYAEQDGHKIWSASYANGTGQISQDDDTKNNGALLIRSIRYLSTPSVSTNPISTPSGYTLSSEGYSDQDGYRVWTASYASGTGLINQDIRYSQSINQGTVGVTVYTISYLSVPSVSSNPITTPASSVKISESYQDQDGYRLWNATYAKGTGLVQLDIDRRYQNKLIIYHAVYINVVPTDPAPTIGGTVVNTQADYRYADGITVYDYRWTEANGVIEKRIQPRDGGLRAESWVSVGASYNYITMQPAGVLMVFDEELLDGYNRYTATCMQSASGGNPTTGSSVSIATKQSFTYPGRAKAFTSSFAAVGFTAYAHDVFLSPPVEVLIDATIDISYQTSTSLGTLPYTLWNPDSWATVRAFWEGWNENASSIIQSHSGYRAVGSPVTFTAGTGYAAGYDNSCMGQKVYGGSSGYITVSGGPSAPDGNTYTLAASIDASPAFTDSSGTKYYRKTIVYATIPSQAALPV